MRIKGAALGPLVTNCYWVVDEEAGEAIVIDPGMGPEPVLDELAGLSVRAILLTHGHYDHIAGVGAVREATGAPVWISAREAEWLVNPELNRSAYRPGFFSTPITGPAADRLLKPGETFTFAGVTWHALPTPGHTPGHLAFSAGGVVFAGDSLFHLSVARTDLPEGSAPQLARSIRTQLFTLPDETSVLPGHGPVTTVGREKARNPFVGKEGRWGRL
jgi:hydroxyacylglutathione hydrolase